MLDEIRHEALAAQDSALYEGTVVHTVSSETTGLMVRVHGFGADRGKHAFGPLPWMPRVIPGSDPAQILYPQKGDRVWVAFDDSGEGVVVAHWPF